jgi:flagellar basal-body rod protein FlgC
VAEIGGVRGLLRGLAIPASGLSAQSRRMDVIAMNIANAETTRTADGGAYVRRILQLQEAQQQSRSAGPSGIPLRRGSFVPEVPDVPAAGSFPIAAEEAFGVEAYGVTEDSSEGPLVYEPGHPDADSSGYVRYPNVDLTRETIDLMETRRAYEANATVFDAMKSMLRRAIQI